jgi:hypothetical protein
MECMIVWKDAWLARIDEAGPGPSVSAHSAPSLELQQRVSANVRPTERQTAGGEHVYSCQATQMPTATTHLSVWDMRQYVEDFVSGNAGLRQIASVLCFLVYDTVASSGIGLGSFMRWSYEAVQRFGNGTTYPSRRGKLANNARTPTCSLDVRPGERVTIKTHAQVLETVTEELVNRGMAFHPEMVPYCSKTFVVESSRSVCAAS